MVIKRICIAVLLGLSCPTSSFVSAKECPEGSVSECGAVISIENPDKGKKEAWAISNAGGKNNKGGGGKNNKGGGGKNNQDGGGLRGDMCSKLHQHCDECTPGFKSCKECADYSDDGGFKYEMVEGKCMIPVVNFDDIEGSPPGWLAPIPDEYKGLDWPNFKVMNSPELVHPGSGYEYGNTSPPNVVFNNRGDPVRIVAPQGSTFSFHSMQATSAFYFPTFLTIEAYEEGNLMPKETLTHTLMSTTAPEEIIVDFENIHMLKMSTSNALVAFDDLLFY